MNNKLAFIFLCGFSSVANANESSVPDTGEIYVHGMVYENTCRMEMDSSAQDIDMGEVNRAQLNASPKGANGKLLKIYLRDCPEINTWSPNISTLKTTRSQLQPGYQATFLAQMDESAPDLIKVHGASGLGLRLRDANGKTVLLSRQSDTLLLSPRQDQIVYTIYPEKDQAMFVPGEYHALLSLSMYYQ